MNRLLHWAFGVVLCGLFALAVRPGVADEATDAVMARHPLYPVVAAILYLHTGKDLDSLSNQEVADAVAGIITNHPELDSAVVAAITHGAMALRAEAGEQIRDAAIEARLAVSSQEETTTATHDTSEEELSGGNKRRGSMRPAPGQEDETVNDKSYQTSRRSELYEQYFEKMNARWTQWAAIHDDLGQIGTAIDTEAARAQAQLAAEQALAQLVQTTQQSEADIMRQMSAFFDVVRRMVGSVMSSELQLTRKVRQTPDYGSIIDLLRLFLIPLEPASPQ